MTGLFRRLARQVIGPDPARVHAMARLPFVAPPGMIAAEGTGSPEPEIDGPAPTAPPDARNPHEAAAPAAVSAPETSKSEPDPAPAASRDAQIPARTAPERPRRAVRRRSAAAAEDAQVPPPLLNEPRQTVHADTGPDDTTFRTPPSAEAASAPAAEASPRFVPPPIVTQPAVAAGERGMRPAERAAASAPRSRRTGGPIEPSASRGDEPAEVHVHIGRIEVTAIQEPAAPRHKPRAGPQPMPLDEYLKRRQRGRT